MRVLLLIAGCGDLSSYNGAVAFQDTAPPILVDPVDREDDTGVPDDGGGLGAEDCTNGVDDDRNGFTDCDDSACFRTCDSDGDGAWSEAVGGDDCDDNDAAINPSAVEVCNDGVDNDCDGELCEDFADDFDGGALDPLWSVAGDAGFSLEPGGRSGDGARSGVITHDEDSRLSISLDFPSGGSLSFWHTGETEERYDFLVLYVDGVAVAEWSGTWSWTQETVQVSSGLHTFSWRYEKDFSISVGQDSVMIDDVTTVGGTP